MRIAARLLISFLFILLFLCSPALAGLQVKKITENECAQMEAAEIVWDLSKYRWLCCILKNEDEYETCIPITDMKPLPKTSLKPFPPAETQTIEKNPPQP